MKLKYLRDLLILPIVLSSCSSSTEEVKPDDPPQEVKKEIKISTRINAATRATDSGFDANDRAGLYVVNRGEGNNSIPLQNAGNHADNVGFTYNGTWTPDQTIYWKDNTTHADFYFYYPYKANVTDVSAMPFNVNADQSNESSYKASELLIGSTQNVAPTSKGVNITVSHALSQIQITVAAGNGFTAESLAAADVNVSINGVKTNASVNLATAAVSATGDAQSIKPWKTDGIYKALIVPQTVDETNLITVNLDDHDFNLNKGFTFVGGKIHEFTVTISKASGGVNVDIGQWDRDGVDNGGMAI